MSLETALGHCALSTVQAGLACGFAAETGGLGAMLCATAVGDAALDCFDAGKEAAEAYEKNFPDQLPEPPPATETPPEMCIDPAASNDASWNEFYVTGAVYLSRNATESQLSTLGFAGRLLTLMHAGTALQITPDSPSTSPEQARGGPCTRFCVNAFSQ